MSPGDAETALPHTTKPGAAFPIAFVFIYLSCLNDFISISFSVKAKVLDYLPKWITRLFSCWITELGAAFFPLQSRSKWYTGVS